MKNSLIAETKITINATPAQVWKALTTPGLIKKWLMGTNTVSHFTEGSTITYEGEHEGKKYHDKGIIKKADPEKELQTTYLSSMSGKKDKPENYNLVTYSLSQQDNKTVLTLTQDNIATEEEKDHSSNNWKMVLEKLKEVVENEI